MNEFELIKKHFLPLAKGRIEAGGFKDDAAILDVPPGQQLVVTTDMLNEGVHFFAREKPENVARKALRVNLSDLAAMGADPYCYQLALSLPFDVEENWLEAFVKELAVDQEEFNIFCCGGDTTGHKGQFSVAITAFGLVPEGKAVKRSGAKEGDAIMLSGFVGDPAVGFHVRESHLKTPNDDYFLSRYLSPFPRLDLVSQMRGYAHGAMDISDGLVADLMHMAKASGLAAEVDLNKMEFSKPAAQMLEKGTVTPQQLLTGGDDYELLMAVPPEHIDKFPECQVIGSFKAGEGVSVLDKSGKPLEFKHTGWSHF